ncbi:hypothetical protein Dimus_038320 [Dionaea muscipula]
MVTAAHVGRGPVAKRRAEWEKSSIDVRTDKLEANSAKLGPKLTQSLVQELQMKEKKSSYDPYMKDMMPIKVSNAGFNARILLVSSWRFRVHHQCYCNAGCTGIRLV